MNGTVESTIKTLPIEPGDFDNALRQAPPGLMAEFGVASGKSIRTMAKLAPDRQFYGFDWFQGLPERWRGDHKGQFRCDPPFDLPPNVELVIGLFQETVKPFCDVMQKPFGFIHFDADLYSSTRAALEALNPWLHDTIMAFDEITGDNDCREHEGRAFQEWLDATGRPWAIIGRHQYNGAIFRVWK